MTFFNLRDRSQSLADEIIAAIVVYLGGLVISSVVARSAYLAGLPLYQGIAIAVAVLFLLTLSVNILSLVFARHRKAAIEPEPNKKPILNLQDVYLERSDDNPDTTYKRKLRVVLRNDSGKDVIVHAATWRSTTGDIAVQPLARHSWQFEAARGWENNSWKKEEHSETLIKPGQVLQTWIGLHASADETEVRRRHVTKRLGTLVIPLKIDGRSEDQTIQL